MTWTRVDDENPLPRTSSTEVELAGRRFTLQLIQGPDIGRLQISQGDWTGWHDHTEFRLGYDSSRGDASQSDPTNTAQRPEHVLGDLLSKSVTESLTGTRWNRRVHRFDRTVTGYRSGDWETSHGRLTWSFFGEDQMLTMHFHNAEAVTTGSVEEIKRILYFGLRKVTGHLRIVGILPDDCGYVVRVDPQVLIGEPKSKRQVVLLRQKDDFLEDPRRGQVKFVLLTVDFDVAPHETSPSAEGCGDHSVGDAEVTETTPPVSVTSALRATITVACAAAAVAVGVAAGLLIQGMS